jgi:hypothetical protein
MWGGTPFPSMTVLSFPYSLSFSTALSVPCRPSVSATALSLQPPSPFCHPERSRGICGSADHSWKCFSTRPAVIVSVGAVLRWKCRPGNDTSFLDGDELIRLNSRESLNQTIGPVNFQIGMTTCSQAEVKPAIVH